MSYSNEPTRFLQELRAEYNRPFSGWDFSYLKGRVIDDIIQIPWNYQTSVITALSQAHSVLDLGTGGGEFLSALPSLLNDTQATEAYAPNIPIARQRLEPLGIMVHALDDEKQLPFPDNRFDLVINRHESYVPQEIKRILRPGGQFITQQVGGRNELELNALLGGVADFGMSHWDCDYAVNELQQVGLQIVEQQEIFTPKRFLDVGAVVYYLKAIPWQIEDFSVEKYIEPLAHIRDLIDRNGWIEVRNHYFFIIARKP